MSTTVFSLLFAYWRSISGLVSFFYSIIRISGFFSLNGGGTGNGDSKGFLATVVVSLGLLPLPRPLPLYLPIESGLLIWPLPIFCFLFYPLWVGLPLLLGALISSLSSLSESEGIYLTFLVMLWKSYGILVGLPLPLLLFFSGGL